MQVWECQNPTTPQPTHTHTHTQLFHGSMDFVWDNPGEPVPEETFIHSHVSSSSIIPNLLHPSTTIHGILPVQFTCQTVFFHNLCSSFLWSTSLHPPLHTTYISSPNHCLLFTTHRNLFCCSTEIMSFNPSLSLNPLLAILSCNFTPNIHLTILISARRSATSFSFLTARSHFHATYYFAHNRCTISLSFQ